MEFAVMLSFNASSQGVSEGPSPINSNKLNINSRRIESSHHHISNWRQFLNKIQTLTIFPKTLSKTLEKHFNLREKRKKEIVHQLAISKEIKPATNSVRQDSLKRRLEAEYKKKVQCRNITRRDLIM